MPVRIEYSCGCRIGSDALPPTYNTRAAVNNLKRSRDGETKDSLVVDSDAKCPECIRRQSEYTRTRTPLL